MVAEGADRHDGHGGGQVERPQARERAGRDVLGAEDQDDLRRGLARVREEGRRLVSEAAVGALGQAVLVDDDLVPALVQHGREEKHRGEAALVPLPGVEKDHDAISRCGAKRSAWARRKFAAEKVPSRACALRTCAA